MVQIIMMNTTQISGSLGIQDWILYGILLYGFWRFTKWIYVKAWTKWDEVFER